MLHAYVQEDQVTFRSHESSRSAAAHKICQQFWSTHSRLFSCPNHLPCQMRIRIGCFEDHHYSAYGTCNCYHEGLLFFRHIPQYHLCLLHTSLCQHSNDNSASQIHYDKMVSASFPMQDGYIPASWSSDNMSDTFNILQYCIQFLEDHDPAHIQTSKQNQAKTD